ncbi:MAG: tetratricopeptide repeat protein [Bacteroidales bacterium]|nr:tetratricopeptide repeat protein [Bacteroidales bacterium]
MSCLLNKIKFQITKSNFCINNYIILILFFTITSTSFCQEFDYEKYKAKISKYELEDLKRSSFYLGLIYICTASNDSIALEKIALERIALSNEFISRNYEDGNIYHELGQGYCYFYEYKKAIIAFTKGLEYTDNKAFNYKDRGDCKFEMNDFRGARDDFENSIKNNLEYLKDIYSKMGDCSVELKEYSLAISDYTKAIELNPEQGILYYYRGLCKFSIGNYRESIQDFSKIIEQHPNCIDAYFYRGQSKHKMEDYRGAIQDYNKTIEYDNNSDYNMAYFNRGINKYSLKDYHGAIIDLSKAIELNIEVRVAYLARGMCKYYLNDINAACLDLSKAGELGHPDAYDLIKKHCN